MPTARSSCDLADRHQPHLRAAPDPSIDALLAATALAHDLTLVTRNSRHVAGLGIVVLNPFEQPAAR